MRFLARGFAACLILTLAMGMSGGAWAQQIGINSTTGPLLFSAGNGGNPGTAAFMTIIPNTGYVGIGTGMVAPTTSLELLQNTAINIGQTAYFSSGATYAHLSTNEWFNGSGWVTNGSAGTLLQLQNNGAVVFYYHDAAGVHTTTASFSTGSATINSPTTINNTLTATGNVTAPAYFYSSDARLKTDIHPLSHALDKVMALDGVAFNWKKDSHAAPGTTDQIGFIAQDVERVVPEIVTANPDGIKAIDYARITPLLVDAIHEQQKEIDALKAEVKALKAQQ